jgi:uncharacterized phage protein (TIGR01671 family)
MRQIKFRVWDEDNNTIGTVLSFTNLESLRHDLDGIEDYFGRGYFKDNPNYLMQFTGLKDKNGVYIYEGDIVSTRTLSAELNDLGFENYEVGFFNGTFCLIENEQAIRQWKDGTNDWYSLENTESFEIEVIGNIHENKN